MLILALSLFMTEPAPLDMPRAEAFFVREDGRMRLEDRYDKLDLWYSQTMVGRWYDEEGREFTLSRLDFEPPPIQRSETVTREEYAERRVAMKRVRANHKLPSGFTDAVGLLSPCPIAESPRSSRQLPHGFRDVTYWQLPTNYSAIVCTFRPEKAELWYLATWTLAEGDDYAERIQQFEEKFLRGDFLTYRAEHPEPPPRRDGERRKEWLSERELLRADARHAVAAYPNWHFTGAEEFAVIDDLPSRDFIASLTNEFATMRARYSAALPTPIDASNVLCVARLYANRDEYEDALESSGLTNMIWSAAYWSPERRELVAYLSKQGEQELLKTVRHEAFHQYLSYAASMIPVSPWLNEGYAQYFEDEKSRDWGREFDPTEENLAKFAASLPGILAMDYAEFYDGSDIVRRFKYRLAWSVAVFLEQGADKVRFQPFKTVKQDYFKELFSSQDMRKATVAAFKNADTLKLFVAEWRKFWQNP